MRIGRDAGDVEHGDMMEIGPLAILPGHQGKGFGTILLRQALQFGIKSGLPRAVLSVNAENTPALGLYLREGFQVEQGYACMREDF